MLDVARWGVAGDDADLRISWIVFGVEAQPWGWIGKWSNTEFLMVEEE